MAGKTKGEIMDQNISYLFYITIPVIDIILYVVHEEWLWEIIVVSLLILFVVRYVSVMHSQKETLNIIQGDEVLYFTLSDDLLFSVQIGKEQKRNELLREVIEKEIVVMRDIVHRIDFVNFKNDRLQRELNALIKEREE